MLFAPNLGVYKSQGKCDNWVCHFCKKKSGIKDVDEQNMNPRKLLLLAQTGPKLPERNKKNEIINIKDFVDEEYF